MIVVCRFISRTSKIVKDPLDQNQKMNQQKQNFSTLQHIAANHGRIPLIRYLGHRTVIPRIFRSLIFSWKIVSLDKNPNRTVRKFTLDMNFMILVGIAESAMQI